MTYTPPVRAQRFVLDEIVGLPALASAFPDLTPDLTAQVLEEAARLAAGVWAPLSREGDRAGARLDQGRVRTAEGFARAYAAFAEGGWQGLPFSPADGGQGLPRTLALAVQEMWQGANMALGLCPLLTNGAIEALSAHGTAEQKRLYLPKLVSGAWTGTMNLTEPQAGSDVGALRTRAERAGDGVYRIFGSKIYITWGEHELAENIVHLVLARLPDAPPGTRGISLFLVPKFLPDADGSPGARNDVRCVGLERKLGIHGSPTCTMAYGEQGGAIGTLIGAENKGMACMFTMMNNARLLVGVQGVGQAERATQTARAYARERRQGKPFGLQHDPVEMIPIVQHADVRRMLLTMQALTEAARAICYATAFAADRAHAAETAQDRAAAKAREELLTPIAKAWSTDAAVQAATLGVQVHGGMGFIEDAGAAQIYRDARILPIYEGTNGIQAIDLAARKLALDGGGAARAFLDEIGETVRLLTDAQDPACAAISAELAKGHAAAARAAQWLQQRLKEGRAPDALAGATPFLALLGFVAGAHFLGRGALAASRRIAAGDPEAAFYRARLTVARFFAEQLLPQAEGLVTPATRGADLLYALAHDEV